jgi:hypothetical protein
MLDYKRAQFVCLSAKLEVIRRSDEEKSSRKKNHNKRKRDERTQQRERMSGRERKRERRMCRKTNCRICFYRTVFLTGKSTHQFYGGRP